MNYLNHFSLKERPFTISPDPRFLFMSNRYREALAHLTYGVQEGGGFVLLTGEVGTGKTTVCRCLLQQLPENTRLAFVLNPKLNSLELLATICDELKIEYPENCSSLKILTDKLSEYLLSSYQQDLNVVVMIDEAQNLATDVLEQIRLLTNLETNQKKLLQIILVGQPELQEKLAQRELRQLAQRITARYHLRPLNLKETIAYVLHRVRIAGAIKAPFSRNSIEYLHNKTMGIPRLVNTICDRALFAAASRNKERVDKAIMAQAVKEVMGETVSQAAYDGNKKSWFESSRLRFSFASLFILLIAFSAYWFGQNQSKTVNSAINYQLESQLDSQSSRQQGNRQNRQLSGSGLSNSDLQHSTTKTATNKSNIRTVSLSAQQNSENLAMQIVGEQRWDNNGQWSMQSLLALWQIDYSPLRDGNACDFASSYGLKCVEQQGQWQMLREYNRPVALKLSAGLQGDFWVTLKSLKGFDAELIVGDKNISVSMDKLSGLWSGDFMMLWQAPEGFMSAIKFGDRGESVKWLSSSLNRINQLDETPKSQFNNQLKQDLKLFQTQRQINADGIAGMQTILKINTETLKGIPVLVE